MESKRLILNTGTILSLMMPAEMIPEFKGFCEDVCHTGFDANSCAYQYVQNLVFVESFNGYNENHVFLTDSWLAYKYLISMCLCILTDSSNPLLFIYIIHLNVDKFRTKIDTHLSLTVYLSMSFKRLLYCILSNIPAPALHFTSFPQLVK